MAPPKSSNFERIVVHAIKKLQDIQGSTPKEITNYLSQEYNVSSDEMKKQVRLALRRGIDYGLLERQKGGFYICNHDYLHQNNAYKDDKHVGDCYTRMGKSKRRSRGRKSSRGRRGRSRRRKSSKSRGRRRRRRKGRGKRKRSTSGGRRRKRSGGKSKRR